ncbi:MAG: glycosyltransferase [Patescibacteria group bacterium]|nr:glycosyltransferase [Patescibacteria group bacterium]MDD5490729.1 glycosyltransferase [Patescibacteria group bacterium]
MKIGIISNFYYPYERGGAERIAAKIANGLAHRGYQIFVITTKPKESGLGQEVKGGQLIYRFFPKNLYWLGDAHKHSWIKRFFWHIFDTFNFYSFKEIKKILKKEKPDVVLTHNLKGIGLLTPLLLGILKIKHIHTLHDIQLINPSGIVLWGEEKKIKNCNFVLAIYAFICQKLFSSPAVVISPSRWLLSVHSFAGFFPTSKRTILPNPIMLFDADISEGERSEKFRLLYLGQIEKHKGILWLIENFKNINNDNLTLRIVGGGAAMGEAQRLVGEDKRISVEGPVEQREVGKIFSQADLTIVPSLCYENSPSVIYESLYYGVPAVAANIGGVGELVELGKNGFTFEPGNGEEFAGILKYILASPEEYLKMKNNARLSVAKYNLDNYIGGLEKLFS